MQNESLSQKAKQAFGGGHMSQSYGENSCCFWPWPEKLLFAVGNSYADSHNWSKCSGGRESSTSSSLAKLKEGKKYVKTGRPEGELWGAHFQTWLVRAWNRSVWTSTASSQPKFQHWWGWEGPQGPTLIRGAIDSWWQLKERRVTVLWEDVTVGRWLVPWWVASHPRACEQL